MEIKRGYILVGIIATLFVALLAGCGDTGCHENRSSIAQAAFYASNLPDQKITVDSITVYGVGQEQGALLVDCGRKVSSFALPFRIDADTTQFVIHYDAKHLSSPSYNDTLTCVYRRYPYFISGDCGVVFNYSIDTIYYTRNILASAALVAKEVTNVEQENIRIYYYVAQ